MTEATAPAMPHLGDAPDCEYLGDWPLIVAIICFFVMMSAQGLIGPNRGALASAAVPDHPGTGSAVLGFVQWVATGNIAPIAGLGGEHTAVPMAILMIGGAAASMIGLVLAKPAATHAYQCAPVRSTPP